MEKNFLLEVFKLQQQIERLGFDEGRGLDKICFAPVVYPGQETTLSDCTVQSVFGYFQNSYDEFNYESIDPLGYRNNYIDTIKACSS